MSPEFDFFTASERDDYNDTMSILREAAALLARHYGLQPIPEPPGEWATLVRLVLAQGRSAKPPQDCSWLEDGLLASAHEAAGCSVEKIEGYLEAAGQPVKKAPLLRTLAEWWDDRVGTDDDALPGFRERPLETWQAELRALRGVNWELADRILLLVGDLSVYPLDRGSMRIVARHGWVELHAEYDDWQAFFTGASREGEIDLAQLSSWNGRIAKDF